MNIRIFFLASIIIFGVYFFSVVVAEAQTVTLKPQTVSVDKDSNFSLDLDISSVTNLFGIALDIDFNPSLVNFVNAVEGAFLSPNCETSLLSAENPSGKLIVGLARLGADCGGVSGSGNLMTLNFKSLSGSGTVNMSFSNNSLCILSNSQCNIVVGTWVPATVTIEDSQSSNDTTPPSILVGSPAGSLSSGTKSTPISVTTNENATCRYSPSSNTSYSSMQNTFTSTGNTSHSTSVADLQDGNNYSYYIRCQDISLNANTSDYAISFSISQSSSAPICSSFSYTAWSTCSSLNTQSRSVQTYSPSGCVGGAPVTTQPCVYASPTTSDAVGSSDNSEDSDDLGTTQTQITTSQSDVGQAIIGPFSIGKTSDQVKLLQQTLAKEKAIYPEANTSGYYGSLTTKAVQRFQCKYMNICSGTPSSNGYGLAGPQTRQKLNEVFASQIPNTKPQITNNTQTNLTQMQIDAIINLLVSFNAEQSVVDNVRASLGDEIQTTQTQITTSQSDVGQAIIGPFSIGKTSDQVKLLQQTLAKEKAIYPEANTSGYYGSLTTKAVQRFQCKYMNICSGTPSSNGYGLAGPKTREKINEVY